MITDYQVYMALIISVVTSVLAITLTGCIYIAINITNYCFY